MLDALAASSRTTVKADGLSGASALEKSKQPERKESRRKVEIKIKSKEKKASSSMGAN